MITFTPVYHEISSPLKDAEKFVTNKGTESLATQMAERTKNNFCPTHPEALNEIGIDMLGTDKYWMSVKNYCCPEFKQKLDMICDNKDPFQTS